MVEIINYKKVIFSKKLDEEFENISKKIETLKLPMGFLEFILYSLSELFANIKEHSKATKVSLEIKMNKTCFIKITDNGIGLRNSYLFRDIYPKDDVSAIEFALAGLSTKDLKERGYGFYTIKKLIEGLRGKMKIKTGMSLAEIKENGIQFKNISKREKGVHILLETKIKALDFYKIIK